MRCIRLHNSDANEREHIRKTLLQDIDKFDVVITTYEMAKSKNLRYALCVQTIWQYAVYDEGHKLKNELSDISDRAARIRSRGRIILTGTLCKTICTNYGRCFSTFAQTYSQRRVHLRSSTPRST